MRASEGPKQFLGEKQRIPQVEAAIRALREVVAVGGPGLAIHACAEATATGLREEFQSRCEKNGLKPSPSDRVCGNRLIGKQASLTHREGGCCPPGWDHGELWLKDRRPEMLVYHPYAMAMDDLTQLQAWCEERGLTYRVSPTSHYFPGRTWQVEVTRLPPRTDH